MQWLTHGEPHTHRKQNFLGKTPEGLHPELTSPQSLPTYTTRWSKWNTTPPIHTDHKVFEMHVKLDKFKTGRGYPKVKTSLYCDPDFVAKISNMISETSLA